MQAEPRYREVKDLCISELERSIPAGSVDVMLDVRRGKGRLCVARVVVVDEDEGSEGVSTLSTATRERAPVSLSPTSMSHPALAL